MEQKPKIVRPTKKQKEMLDFIDSFITDNDYSPSYREIMRGCGYNSVATVAAHVNNLIKRGHLVKRQNSARSLEVVNSSRSSLAQAPAGKNELKWLKQQLNQHFSNPRHVDDLYVLLGALKVLGLEREFTKYKQLLDDQIKGQND